MNSEKAVEHFYDWEINGRGYSLFSYPVYLEPPYREFYHFYDNTEYVDDGKVPTFFERLFPKKALVIIEEVEEERPPKVFEFDPFLVQIKIHFPAKQEFDNKLFIEFLNMLSD